MKKIYILAATLIFSATSFAQNIGINATGAAPNASAMLDVSATNKGVLIPRVALSSTTDATTVPGAATSLLVYNTATAGSGATAVYPGYYYWDGTQWVAFGGTGGKDWSLLGNAGTTAGTNFLGTTDAQDLVFKTNTTERARFLSTGPFLVNATAQLSTEQMRVSGGSNYAIRAENNSASDVIWAQNNGSGDGVHGSAYGNGDAIYGYAGGTGTGISGYSVSGDGAAGTANTSTTFGGSFYNTNSSGTGLISTGNALGGTYLTGGTGIAANGNSGLFAYGKSTTGTGVIGVGNNNTAINTLAAGSGAAFTGTTTGIYAYYTTAGDGQGLLIQDAYGAQWNVGAWWGAGGGYFKIIGNGSVSTIVKDLNDEPVVMICPESPEAWYQDYGEGKLINGKAHITLDPIFVKNILVDSIHPIKVFVQLEGNCNGVYVTNKTQESFDVIELQNGTSNVKFSYTVVASKAPEVYTNKKTGETRIASYSRFAPAPTYNGVVSQDVKEIKIKKADKELKTEE